MSRLLAPSTFSVAMLAAARFQIGRYAAADADAGNDERGKADQRQEFAHPIDEPVRAGRCAVAGAEIETGIGEAFGEGGFHIFGCGGTWKRDAVFALIHRAGCQQTRRRRNILRPR